MENIKVWFSQKCYYCEVVDIKALQEWHGEAIDLNNKEEAYCLAMQYASEKMPLYPCDADELEDDSPSDEIERRK